MAEKIVICSNTLWSIINFRLDLILSLKNSGYEIQVIVTDASFFDPKQSVLTDIEIKPIILPMDRSKFNPFRDGIFFIKILKTLRRLSPVIAMFFTIKPNIYGSLVCRLLKIPFINTISGLGSGLIHENLKSKFINTLYSVSLKNSCKVLFQNISDNKYFIERKIIKREQAVYVPGSGIDVEKFKLPVQKINEPRTFLFAGRILKDKGVLEYIEAIRELRKNSNFSKTVFLLGGIVDESNISGVSMKEIRMWEDQNIISYIGKTDNIIEFFKKTDIVVLPSYREGLSRVLLEAASCGKALITTDVPGCNDLVEEGVTGFLCKPRDAYSLRDAIIRSLNTSDSELIQIGQNGRQKVMKKFNTGIVNKIYQDLVNVCLRKA
jgi:glycosyltransferase involved in cell wall biosynthesis